MCMQTQTQVSLDLLAAQSAEGLTAWHAQPAVLYNMCCSCSTMGEEETVGQLAFLGARAAVACWQQRLWRSAASLRLTEYFTSCDGRFYGGLWSLGFIFLSEPPSEKQRVFGYLFAHSQTDAKARVLSRDETAWCEKSTQCLQHINQEREHR